MVRGGSGRIVIEVDTHLKGELYVELARRGLTLKAWFVSEAEILVANPGQLSLFDFGGPTKMGRSAATPAAPLITARSIQRDHTAPKHSSRATGR